MIQLSMPYKVSTVDIYTDLESLGFDISKYINTLKRYTLKTILVLTGKGLMCVKCRDQNIDTSTEFQVIHIDSKSGNITDKILSDHIILSTVPEFQWGAADNYEEFSPKKGDSFIHVSPSSDKFGEMDMLWMCIELSYCFGNKFYFYNEDGIKSFNILLDRNCTCDSMIMGKIEKHRNEIEETYKVKMDITKRFMPKKDYFIDAE